MPNKPKPHSDEEAVRRVEQERPGARATDPTFDAIIEAILDADPEAVREHQKRRRIIQPKRIKRTDCPARTSEQTDNNEQNSNDS